MDLYYALHNMAFLKKLSHSFLILNLLSISSALNAIPSESVEEIKFLLKKSADIEEKRDRLLFVSEALLDRPFEWGPCGESAFGAYDTKPLTRLDVFDCTTFVEVVLAMSLSNSSAEFSDFLKTFREIKYCNANEVCYSNRNHFTSLHWVPNVIKKGFLRDITTEIFADAPERRKWIDTQAWLNEKIDALDPQDPRYDAKKRELKQIGPNQVVSELGKLKYVPLKNLLENSVKEKLLEERVVLFNLVKNERSTKETFVMVTHQGFIIEKEGELYLRHASSEAKVTGDVKFEDYIQARMKDENWPTLGFHLMGFNDSSK